jgi:hypothetical protein
MYLSYVPSIYRSLCILVCLKTVVVRIPSKRRMVMNDEYEKSGMKQPQFDCRDIWANGPRKTER